jgi:hypothetical protein
MEARPLHYNGTAKIPSVDHSMQRNPLISQGAGICFIRLRLVDVIALRRLEDAQSIVRKFRGAGSGLKGGLARGNGSIRMGISQIEAGRSRHVDCLDQDRDNH